MISKKIIVHTDDFVIVILKISEKYVMILMGIINHEESICRCGYIRGRKIIVRLNIGKSNELVAYENAVFTFAVFILLEKKKTS